MIILAGAIVLSLSSSGIIGKANQSKADMNEATLKEAAAILYSEWQMEKEIKNIEEALEYIKIRLVQQGFTDTEIAKVNIDRKGNLQILQIDPRLNKKEIIIKGEEQIIS